MRRLALPQGVEHWSLTALREKLAKIGAKVTGHAKYVTFQLAEAVVRREPRSDRPVGDSATERAWMCALNNSNGGKRGLCGENARRN
jgi:hypothetical protein